MISADARINAPRSAIITGMTSIEALTAAALALADDYDRVTVIYPAVAFDDEAAIAPAAGIFYFAVEGALEDRDFWKQAIAATVEKFGSVDLWLDFTSAQA